MLYPACDLCAIPALLDACCHTQRKTAGAYYNNMTVLERACKHGVFTGSGSESLHARALSAVAALHAQQMGKSPAPGDEQVASSPVDVVDMFKMTKNMCW